MYAADTTEIEMLLHNTGYNTVCRSDTASIRYISSICLAVKLATAVTTAHLRLAIWTGDDWLQRAHGPRRLRLWLGLYAEENRANVGCHSLPKRVAISSPDEVAVERIKDATYVDVISHSQTYEHTVYENVT